MGLIFERVLFLDMSIMRRLFVDSALAGTRSAGGCLDGCRNRHLGLRLCAAVSSATGPWVMVVVIVAMVA